MPAPEVVDHAAASAAAELPRDLAVVKMENDQIFALAAARPRDMDEIKNQLEKMIVSFPQFADEAIYEKPVGRDDDNKMKFARGLSVRAAECLAEMYGYNRTRADVDPLPDGKVKIYSSFTDYQRCRVWETSTVLSPYYRTKGGAVARHPEDRFYNVVVKAEASKLIREVINRSVNQALKAWFEARCEQQLATRLDDAAIGKIVAGFKTFGLNTEQVEQIVGRPIAMGWTVQDRLRLVGVFNALKAGETTVGELLGKPETKPEPPKTGTVGDMLDPKGKTETRTHGAHEPASVVGSEQLADAVVAGKDVGVKSVPPPEGSTAWWLEAVKLRQTKAAVLGFHATFDSQRASKSKSDQEAIESAFASQLEACTQ